MSANAADRKRKEENIKLRTKDWAVGSLKSITIYLQAEPWDPRVLDPVSLAQMEELLELSNRSSIAADVFPTGLDVSYFSAEWAVLNKPFSVYRQI